MEKIKRVEYYPTSWRDCVGNERNRYANNAANAINQQITSFENAVQTAEYHCKYMKKYESCSSQIPSLIYRGEV